MKIEIPYGRDGQMELHPPEEGFLGVFGPNQVEPGEEARVLSAAFSRPVGAPPLEEFLQGAQDILVLVNDATRPTPTARILDQMAPWLRGRPVTFLVATGIHRAPTEEELRGIFGGHFSEYRQRIFAHDCRRQQELVSVGRSRTGTEMIINRRALAADRILIISSVEPHYFAGYTGGRKSLLPGIAAYATIEQNHRLALKPQAQALRLSGNPVHEDMVDAVRTVAKPMYAIQTVLDSRHRLYAACVGDLEQSLAEAIRRAEEVFCVRVPGRAEIVVSVVKPPADIDLYQAQKGIDNGKLALRPGGVLILVAECREGIGERAFYELLGSAGSPREVLEKIAGGYRLGWHKAAKMAEVMLHSELWAVSGIAREMLEKIFIRSFASPRDALAAALEKLGPRARVLVLLDASLAVPRLEDEK